MGRELNHSLTSHAIAADCSKNLNMHVALVGSAGWRSYRKRLPPSQLNLACQVAARILQISGVSSAQQNLVQLLLSRVNLRFFSSLLRFAVAGRCAQSTYTIPLCFRNIDACVDPKKCKTARRVHTDDTRTIRTTTTTTTTMTKTTKTSWTPRQAHLCDEDQGCQDHQNPKARGRPEGSPFFPPCNGGPHEGASLCGHARIGGTSSVSWAPLGAGGRRQWPPPLLRKQVRIPQCHYLFSHCLDKNLCYTATLCLQQQQQRPQRLSSITCICFIGFSDPQRHVVRQCFGSLCWPCWTPGVQRCIAVYSPALDIR